MSGTRRWQASANRLAAAVLGAFMLFALATLLLQQPPEPRVSRPRFATRAVLAPANNTTVAAQAAATPAERKPGIVFLSDIYVPGYARAHPELCPDEGAHLRLLILVTSAPSHASARDAVRLTWGHFRARSDVAIAFVLGQAPAALEAALVAEDALYGDLIVGNSVDSYQNLTLKTISMLEWKLQYCPQAPYLLKTDDDMFINVPRLLSHVDKAGNASRTIWGRVVYKALPIRSLKSEANSKFFISKQEWGDSVFPDYATGPAYLMTADCVGPLLDAAGEPRRRFMFLEDVFFTGILATELGIKRMLSPAFFNQPLPSTSPPCVIWRKISVHQVLYHEQFEFYLKLLDGTTQCAD